MAAVQLVELLGFDPKHRATFEYLDVNTHLKHVSGRRHDEIGNVSAGQHRFTFSSEARLDTRLVHRPCDNERRPEGESGGHRSWGAKPPCRTDADWSLVVSFGHDRVAQGHH